MSEKRVSVRLTVEGGRVVRAELDGVGQGGERAFQRIERSADSASAVLRRVAGLFAAGFSLHRIGQAADQFTQMSNALRVLDMDQQQVNSTLDELTEISLRTHQPLEAIVQLYQRTAMASSELGASQSEALEFVQATALALASQGGAASEAAGALRQLGQAIGGDIVRAEEFNSILEGAPALARAAARGIDEAGGSVARLRQMVVAGEVESAAFFRAIISQSDSLADAFANTDLTVSQALSDLNTRFVAFIGTLDQASGVSSLVAESIVLLADNLDGLAAVAVGLTATQIPALLGGLRALGLAATLAGGPLGIAIGLVAAGATYFALFRDRAQELPPELQAAQEAQDQLNAALMRFATDASPQAREQVVSHAEDLIALKNAALDAASAELALMEAELARFASAPVEERGLFTGDSEERNMRADVDAARASVADLRAEIARLRETATDPEGAAAQLGAVRDLTQSTRVALEVTQDLGRASSAAADEAAEGWARVSDYLADYATEARDTAGQVADLISGGMTRAEDAILDAFRGGTDGARAFFNYIAEELARMMIRQSVLGPLSTLLGGLLGLPGIGAKVAHTGMIAGVSGGTDRIVDPAIFLNAPRYHSGGMVGLSPDEVPAILQRGERVLNRAETAAYGAEKGRVQSRSETPASGTAVGRIEVSLSPDLVARVLDEAGAQSISISKAHIAQADRALPGRIAQHNRAPRRR